MTYPGWTRRTFLKTGGAAAMGVALGVPGTHHRQPVWFQRQAALGQATLNDPRVKALLASAIDAARTAGAQYAEASATYGRELTINGWPPNVTEVLGLNVRAMVDGHWGFAASSVLGTDDGPRIGRKATQLAKSLVVPNAPRPFTWAPAPRVEDGVWRTPIEVDPFEVPIEEIADFCFGLDNYGVKIGPSMGINDVLFSMGAHWGVLFTKQERLFASTEGSRTFQTRYVSGGVFGIDRQWPPKPGVQLKRFKFEGAGWEYVRDGGLEEALPGLIEESEKPQLPERPLDIGRYDVVFTAAAMAQLLHATLGNATQLDRALGYEANAGGTSYLGPDPMTFLGTPVASPLVRISGNRSLPRGLGTVKWDNEGVETEDFDLVREGVLVDYQTTREQAGWLAPWYERQGRPLRSHGCADAETALQLTMQHTPNLVLHPGSGEETVESLAAGLEKGIIIDSINTGGGMDFQCLNGSVMAGGIKMVRGGKIVSQCGGRGMLFRSPEFWKGVIGLGGPKSQWLARPLASTKGEPSQSRMYSISAVPALVKQVAIIDPMRKS